MSSTRMLCKFSRPLRQQTTVSTRRTAIAPYRPYQRAPFPQGPRCYATSEPLPRVAQPALWHSIVPKFLRKSEGRAQPRKNQLSKEWNPATFYIVMFLFIGSMAIQMIALRNHTTNFNRNADAKIRLLKEVIERVQRGEDVDVEGLLGTGDKAKEREWEEVIREIEEEDRLWQAQGKKRKDSDSELSSEQAERSADTAPIPIDGSVQEPVSADAVPNFDASTNVATKPKTAFEGFY